jgi:hypothetical protein
MAVINFKTKIYYSSLSKTAEWEPLIFQVRCLCPRKEYFFGMQTACRIDGCGPEQIVSPKVSTYYKRYIRLFGFLRFQCGFRCSLLLNDDEVYLFFEMAFLH